MTLDTGVPGPIVPAHGSSIAARVNRLPVTRTHRFAIVVVGIGIFFDIYEVFLAGTLGGVLKSHFKVSPDQLKLILSSAFVGAFVGAVLLSVLADRLGRRRAFFITLGLYSVFSVAAAFSTGMTMLIVFRFLAGVGIGGELPLCDAYLSDLLPARVRGKMIGWAYTVGFFAVPAAGFLARGIATRTVAGWDGWRWMFLLGGVGAAVCWAARRALPESPRWLEAVGRAGEAEAIVARLEREAEQAGHTLAEPEPIEVAPARRQPISALFAAPWRQRTAMLWILQCLQTFGYYGFGSLVPLVLNAKGYSVVTSLSFSAVTFLGYPVGSVLAIPLLERFERRTLIAGGAIAMGVLGIIFGYSGGTAIILVTGFLFTAVSNVFSNAYHVYQSELYPTRLRATGAGAGYSLSRLATAAMPFVLLPLLDDRGAGALFIVISIAMAILAIDVLVLGPRTTGLALEEVTSEPGSRGLPSAHPATEVTTA